MFSQDFCSNSADYSLKKRAILPNVEVEKWKKRKRNVVWRQKLLNGDKK